jgi:hypothetical protein
MAATRRRFTSVRRAQIAQVSAVELTLVSTLSGTSTLALDEVAWWA